MARVLRMLKSVTLNTGDTIALTDSADFVDACSLDIVIRVEQAGSGTAPLLKVQHSATNEEGTWIDFSTPAEADLTTAGLTWVHEDAFTRFAGWTVSGTLETPAVVTVDVIGKS